MWQRQILKIVYASIVFIAFPLMYKQGQNWPKLFGGKYELHTTKWVSLILKLTYLKGSWERWTSVYEVNGDVLT